MTDPRDRRRSTRERVNAYASLETEGRFANNQGFSVTIDVSRHGIGLRTVQPPLVGQGVRIRLAIDEEIHTLKGIVRHITQRSSQTYDVGIDWAGCSEEDLLFLDKYLSFATPPSA